VEKKGFFLKKFDFAFRPDLKYKKRLEFFISGENAESSPFQRIMPLFIPLDLT